MGDVIALQDGARVVVVGAEELTSEML